MGIVGLLLILPTRQSLINETENINKTRTLHMKKMKVPELHKALNKEGYICDVPFAVNIGSAIHSKPVGGAFIYGPAGTGKSYLPHVLAKIMKRELFFHQCSPGTREDDILLSIMPDEDTISGVKETHGKVLQAAIKSRKNEVILVLDEWDKTRPSADGFLLDFLQYGRLSLKGKDIEANLDNMMIFFTANDERDFQEALLRRFPKIDIEPLHPEVVKEALEITHGDNKYLDHCINLYIRCLMSGMNKPATIQELRQLMDAIQYLGGGSDWNTLVYQFITKTPESHSLLVSSEEQNVNEWLSNFTNHNGKIINNDAYSHDVHSRSVQVFNPEMPVLQELRKAEKLDVIPSDEKVKPSEIYGVFDNNDISYTAMVRLSDELPDESHNLQWSKVLESKTILMKPFTMDNICDLLNLNVDGLNGEVMLHFKDFTMSDVKWMINRRHFEVKYITKTEAIFKYVSDSDRWVVDFRYTQDNGLEIILPINTNIEHPVNMINDMFLSRRQLAILSCNSYQSNGAFTVENLHNYALDILYDNRLIQFIGTLSLKHMRHSNCIALKQFSLDISKYRRMHLSHYATSVDYNEDTGLLILKGSNIEIEFSFHNSNDMTVRIFGLLNKNGRIMLEMIHKQSSYRLLIYQCFKVDSNDVLRRMKRNKWCISRNEARRNGIKCAFLNDYFFFYHVFDSSYISDINNRIRSLKQLRRLYEAR